MIVNQPCLMSCYCLCSVALPRMPWVCLQCMIVLFPDLTHLLLEAMAMKILDSIALFGTYCICLTNIHRSNSYEACNRK